VAVRQCRSKFGRGVSRTAIVPTTSSHNGSTPKPGMASRAGPGNSSHCRPSTMNSSSAVPRSTTHTDGIGDACDGEGKASRFLENLRVFEIGVPALNQAKQPISGAFAIGGKGVVAASFRAASGERDCPEKPRAGVGGDPFWGSCVFTARPPARDRCENNQSNPGSRQPARPRQLCDRRGTGDARRGRRRSARAESGGIERELIRTVRPKRSQAEQG